MPFLLNKCYSLSIVLLLCFALTACNQAPDPELELSRAQVALKTNEFSLAEKIYQQIVRTAPANAASEQFMLKALVGLSEAQTKQQKFSQATQSLTQALSIAAKTEDTAKIADLWEMLARVYFCAKKYAESQAAWSDALNILDKTESQDLSKTINAIDGLIAASCANGECIENEDLFKRLLELKRKQYGKEHPLTITSINLLAEFYSKKKNYKEAEALYIQALTVSQKSQPANVPAALVNLARTKCHLDKLAEAKALLDKALCLERQDKTYGTMVHPCLIPTLQTYILLYEKQNNLPKALACSQQVLSITEKMLGKNHLQLPPTLRAHAMLLKKLHRTKEADTLEERIRSIELSNH